MIWESIFPTRLYRSFEKPARSIPLKRPKERRPNTTSSKPSQRARAVNWNRPPLPYDYAACRDDDSAAMSVLDPDTLLDAYCRGVFPMTDPDGRIRWYTADPRGVIPLDAFHIPHTLAQFMRSPRNAFELRIDYDFEQAMRACMLARRGRTWISEPLISAYLKLHNLGFAHSVEVWHNGNLAGGLYGVAIGAAFFGESMFHRETNAS